jgi:predicted DNA binding CopG/RHH family protein
MGKDIQKPTQDGTQDRTKEESRKAPEFKNEDEEREFWSRTDSSEYVDWSGARPLVLPNLKPTLRTISIRVPEHMLAELKLLANKRDVPYQSLIKVFLAERLKVELGRAGGTSQGS